MVVVVEVGGGWEPTFKFDVKSKSAKIPKSLYSKGWGWVGGAGGGVGNQLPPFDAKSKSAKIPKSLLGWSVGSSFK